MKYNWDAGKAKRHLNQGRKKNPERKRKKGEITGKKKARRMRRIREVGKLDGGGKTRWNEH